MQKVDVVGMGSKHTFMTSRNAFLCADQSVLQTALNLQIAEVLVLLPGVRFLQLYSKKKKV